MDNYKTITPTEFASSGNTYETYNYVCTHKVVQIKSKTRPDIMLVLGVDYEQLKADLENATELLGHGRTMIKIQDEAITCLEAKLEVANRAIEILSEEQS